MQGKCPSYPAQESTFNVPLPPAALLRFGLSAGDWDEPRTGHPHRHIITHNAILADMADRVTHFSDGRVHHARENARRGAGRYLNW